MNRMERVRARQATIARAVEHLRTTEPEVLAAQLATTRIHEHLQKNPTRLAQELAEAHNGDSWPRFFGAWKGAQQICHAAGLPDYSS